MQPIQTDAAPAAIGPYSQAIAVGEFLFCSGQVALHPETMTLQGEDVRAQTERVMQNVRGVLAAGGSDLSRVVKATIFLVDMADFATVNEVYGEHFGEHRPARSCVAVRDLPKGALVEIEVMALRNG